MAFVLTQAQKDELAPLIAAAQAGNQSAFRGGQASLSSGGRAS